MLKLCFCNWVYHPLTCLLILEHITSKDSSWSHRCDMNTQSVHTNLHINSHKTNTDPEAYWIGFCVTLISLMRGENKNDRRPLLFYCCLDISFVARWKAHIDSGNSQIHVCRHSHHTLSDAHAQRIWFITLFCADRVIISGGCSRWGCDLVWGCECSLMPSTNDPPGTVQGWSLH